ncbi:MAG: carboxyl transferase [Clostridiales bacterium]|nr:carboxyl transferase [Clostridiales bacterium]
MSISNENEIAARQRMAQLFDDGVFSEIDALAKSPGGESGVIAGFGSVGGAPAYAFSQDINVNGGAVTAAQCKKIKKIYDLAAKTGCPVVGIYDSNGVSLKEGIDVLGEYSDIVKASASVSGVVLQIAVIAGACLGTSAVVANMSDIVIQVENSDFYITTPSSLTAKDCHEAGTADILASDFASAAQSVRELISLLPPNNLAETPLFDFAESETALNSSAGALDAICAVADAGSVIEIKSAWAPGVVTAFATMAGSTVGFVAFDGGALSPKSAYKSEAFIKLCDAYNIPIIMFIDIDSLEKENENAVLVAMTKLVSTYKSATAAKISVITKSAIGAPYVLLGAKNSGADFVFAWENAVLSALEISSAVAFLYNDRLANGEDRKLLESEYAAGAGAVKAAEAGAVDSVFAPGETRAALISALDALAGKRETTIARKHAVK